MLINLWPFKGAGASLYQGRMEVWGGQLSFRNGELAVSYLKIFTMASGQLVAKDIKKNPF